MLRKQTVFIYRMPQCLRHNSGCPLTIAANIKLQFTTAESIAHGEALLFALIYIRFGTCEVREESSWGSGENFPPMQPGIDFRSHRRICFEFVGSLLRAISLRVL